MVYGTQQDVAALTPRNATSSGDFNTTTNPTLIYVDKWLNNVSVMVDAVLRQNGFIVPDDYVGHENVAVFLSQFVVEEVASMVEGVNSSGRFTPTAKQPHREGRFQNTIKHVRNFIDENSNGIERMGLPRDFPELTGIFYAGASGEESNGALFTRSGLGQIVGYT